MDRGYVDENARELQRLRGLVERLNDEQLRSPVNEHWTVAGVLGHIAFWDGRALALGKKLEAGIPFTSSDDEPEEVDWINDASAPLIHAIEPRETARLALQIAEATDALMASLDPRRMYPLDEASPVNPNRAAHRGAHLDDIESALQQVGRGDG